MSPDPDFELLKAWRAGEKQAAAALLEKYFPLVRRIVRQKIPDHAINQVVDRVVEGILKSQTKFRADAKFRTFVVTITKNSIADFHRQRQRRPDFDVLESSVRDLGVSPSGLLLQKEQHRVLLEALRSIPLKDQLLLELFLWEDMTGPELAVVYNCNEPTIRSRLRRAKERLAAVAKEIVEDPRELADTLTDIDDWVRQVREELRPDYIEQPQQKKAK